MNYYTEINNLFSLFINEDSYFPMFQRLGVNISKTNPLFKKVSKMAFSSTQMKLILNN